MYLLLTWLHVTFAGIWLVVFIADPLFKKYISKAKNSKGEIELISLYLKFVNLLGIIGAVGILVTGIWMILMDVGYGFFDFSSNHWLATKQIVMVVILVLLGWKLIPTAKKVRLSISDELKSPVDDNSSVHENLKKLYSVGFQINLLVIINFLMAVTRFLYS